MKALDLKPLELFIVQTKLLPINFKKMDSNLKFKSENILFRCVLTALILL